jgi:D-sedoheptulose 7-phosphate isomerase
MSEYTHIIEQELKQSQHTLQQFLSDSAALAKVEAGAKAMADAIRNDGKIISCGNGGSHCDAMHFAEELSGRYQKNRKALPAIAISDAAHISCVGNDFGFDQVFSRYLEAIGRKGDVLLAISTSGNSENVLKAAVKAKELGMTTVALTGNDGGRLAALADHEVRVPHSGFADRIQEVHIKIIHIFILLIEIQLGYAS